MEFEVEKFCSFLEILSAVLENMENGKINNSRGVQTKALITENQHSESENK
jgi:hypothetical protein